MSCGAAVSDGHRTACMRCGLMSGPTGGETRRLSGMRRVPLEPDLCTVTGTVSARGAVSDAPES